MCVVPDTRRYQWDPSLLVFGMILSFPRINFRVKLSHLALRIELEGKSSRSFYLVDNEVLAAGCTIGEILWNVLDLISHNTTVYVRHWRCTEREIRRK